MIQLCGDERLDYLLAENLRIIQSPTVFSFSLDAVLLANFATIPLQQKGKIIDLCSGNGVIPLLLSTKTKASIVGVEIQERLFSMANRSFSYNQLEERLSMIHGDIKEMPKLLGKERFDSVTCNPPYFPTTSEEKINENIHYAIARHEIYCTLEDVIRVSSQLLKQGGKVTFVHRPGRLVDIVTLMRAYQIEPKRMRLVHPKKDREANTLLIEGIKGGKKDIKVLPPLIVYNEQNQYTEEIRSILYGEK